MSRFFSLALLGTAVWLLASPAVLAQKVPRDKKPLPPAVEKLRPGANVAAIEKALDSATQIEFVETPLQDVVDYLKDYHHIEIQIDAKALKDAGIEPTAPITKNLKGISFRSALNLILREIGLTYVIQDEVLLITTPKEAETQLTTKVYPVADLVACKDSKGESWDDYDTLSDAITGTIQPTTWDQNGGPGSISGASLGTAKVLIVSQTRPVHGQITDLLQQIREIAAVTPGAGPPRREKKEPECRGCCLSPH